MGKLIIVVLLVVMMFPFMAWEETLPTGNELLDNVFQSIKKVESYKEQMDITMEIYLENEEFDSETQLSIVIAGEANAQYDITNEEMMMKIGFDMLSDDEDLSMKMGIEMFLVDGMIYSLFDFPMFRPNGLKPLYLKIIGMM